MEFKKENLYLINFIENAIRNRYFDDDTATYTVHKNATISTLTNI